jgi:hypothetical protein
LGFASLLASQPILGLSSIPNRYLRQKVSASILPEVAVNLAISTSFVGFRPAVAASRKE